MDEPDYSDRLQAALDSKDWTQGDLVRALAERTGNQLESERSTVKGYLRGAAKPSAARARLLAELLDDPGLVRVDGGRQSAAARLDARLAEVEAALKSLLQGQHDGRLDQATMLDQLGELRETLDERLPIQPARKRKGTA